MKSLNIDIVSDLICPWCFIGKRRLDRALRSFRGNYQINLRWLPFELNPNMPTSGMERKIYRSAKFGSLEKSNALDSHVIKTGIMEGIQFNFDKIHVTPNTFDAHRLVLLAQKEGLQDKIVEALYEGYFVDGKDIGDRKILVEISNANGLDATKVEQFLNSEKGVDEIKKEETRLQSLGITGVPHFIINGKYAIEGAQDAQTLISVFESTLKQEKKYQYSDDTNTGII